MFKFIFSNLKLTLIVKPQIAGKVKKNTNKLNLFETRDIPIHTLGVKTHAEPFDAELHIFDLESILIATNHFNTTNKLGQGGFGSVYKVIAFLIQ